MKKLKFKKIDINNLINENKYNPSTISGSIVFKGRVNVKKEGKIIWMRSLKSRKPLYWASEEENVFICSAEDFAISYGAWSRYLKKKMEIKGKLYLINLKNKEYSDPTYWIIDANKIKCGREVYGVIAQNEN